MAMGMWCGVKRCWDQVVAAVGKNVWRMHAQPHAGGGRIVTAPNCAHVTKDKMSASETSVTHIID